MGIVQQKMLILSLFSHPHVVQTCKILVHIQNTNVDIFYESERFCPFADSQHNDQFDASKRS